MGVASSDVLLHTVVVYRLARKLADGAISLVDLEFRSVLDERCQADTSSNPRW
jgi:hypothetical protein